MCLTETYSRGWRGAPAKGVDRETGARVQISLSPPYEINSSLPWVFYLTEKVEPCVLLIYITFKVIFFKRFNYIIKFILRVKIYYRQIFMSK